MSRTSTCRILLCVLAGAGLMAAAGCSSRPADDLKAVPAEYDPAGAKMLIVPFRDKALDYFECPDGKVLSEFAGYYIRAQNVTPVLYHRFFPPGVLSMWEEHQKDPQAAWREIASAIGYDLVLVGQIDDITFPRKDKGELVFSARLYDMRQGGKVVWSRDRQGVTYPEGWEFDDDAGAFPHSKITLTNGLLNKAGERIGMAFHEHMEFERAETAR